MTGQLPESRLPDFSSAEPLGLQGAVDVVVQFVNGGQTFAEDDDLAAAASHVQKEFDCPIKLRGLLIGGENTYKGPEVLYERRALLRVFGSLADGGIGGAERFPVVCAVGARVFVLEPAECGLKGKIGQSEALTRAGCAAGCQMFEGSAPDWLAVGSSAVKGGPAGAHEVIAEFLLQVEFCLLGEASSCIHNLSELVQ
jgi:hypothetical protein